MWIPILERYKHPTHEYLGETVSKPLSRLDEEEKKVYDLEKKAYGSITMALTRELFHSFRGIALFSGSSSQEDDYTNSCINSTCFAASRSNSSRGPTSSSSTHQNVIAKIVEDHVPLFASCMLAYENFIGGNLTNPETIEEDFNQVVPDDMEDVDIEWNMAMILRRAKRFISRTGRKFIGGHSNARDGNNQSYNNQNNRSQNQGTTSNALVVQQDDSFDWGVHLEDATISQTQLGLMAEILELMEAEGREAAANAQQESAFALMAIGESSSTSEVDSNAFAIVSVSFLNCRILKDENDRVHNQLEPLRTAALNYKENEKRFKDSIENIKKDKHDFSIKISEQQFHLDVEYKALEKKNVELAKLQNEILQLSGKLEKLKNSRFVVVHYESIVRQMNGQGLGTNAIPPLVNGKFVNGPVDIDLSCLDESSSKANSISKSNEEGNFVDNIKVDGVVSEEMFDEHKVQKDTITNCDNFILTEPDVVESNKKLNNLLYGCFKTMKQSKKEKFANKLGKNFHENIKKN
ncbi:hypothetical protein L1987_15437 [Smallanthus sonchifolius]|uniref:Uncharacterized protein n=1 Tax=Smallanthus sonchifolius TaxID=185202 RepID=A0ACB9J7Q1_9ASTR|nr:hypothetical protein L1987_15437 [Smallanthus sonchifolius]